MCMKIGVDVGSFAVKTSEMISFESRVSNMSNVLTNDDEFELFGESFYIEEGMADTEYRKVLRGNYIKLLYAAMVKSNAERNVELVLGLPISQFKEDRDRLIEMVCRNSVLKGEVNEEKRDFFIKRVDVYPEGIGAVPGGFNGIVCDIGGRTTDIALLSQRNGKRKIDLPMSEPMGTIPLYSSFIQAINNKYGLDLKLGDADRLLKSGLKIDGITTDISFAKKVFFNFIEELIAKLQVDYSLRTNDICFTGGGSILLKSIINKKIANAVVTDNGVFANAIAFKKYAEEVFR